MNPTERKIFEQRVVRHYDLYAQKFDPGKHLFWWEQLHEFSLEKILIAFDRYEGKYRALAKPAHIRNMVREFLSRTAIIDSHCMAHVFPTCPYKPVINIGKSEKTPLLLCAEHHDELNPSKSDLHIEMEKRSLQLVKHAESMGMTNRQFFQSLANLTVTETTEIESQEIADRQLLTKGIKNALTSKLLINIKRDRPNLAATVIIGGG